MQRRLLVLDDDDAVGNTIRLLAMSLGLDARCVSNPKGFFAEMARWEPHVVVIDLAMPEMDGVEVMRRLSGIQSWVKVIITSGMGSSVLDAARRSGLGHGLDIVGVLPKPLTKQGLCDLLVEIPEVVRGPSVEPKSAPIETPRTSKDDLVNAIANHEFVMMYQPKIACRTTTLDGFEALVRWNHPSRGILAPDTFIPAAENFGLIDALSQQIFRQSIAWFSQAFPDSQERLSLNFSAKSIKDFSLIDQLSNLCREFSIASERIILELTETSAMDDPLLSLDLMTRFRVKGFHLSIDDFGTGYSSMVQLVRLPFSEIKIDRSFVVKGARSQESNTIIKSIVDLGQSLGLAVAAEGVEDLDTLQYLDSLGCGLAQGYFIAKPMPGEVASRWAKERAVTA